MDANEPDDFKHRTHPHGGGRRRPPRGTRIGRGGSRDRGGDDDIGGFGGAGDAFNPQDLMSWPVPQLEFIEVRSADVSPARNHNLSDVLTRLYEMRANVAYLVLSGAEKPRVLMGTSASAAPFSVKSANRSLIAALQEQFSAVSVDDQIQSAADVRDIIDSCAKHVGCVSGFPDSSGTADDTTYAGEPNALFALEGHKFGLLVLAVPIPEQYIGKEVDTVNNRIEKAAAIENPEHRVQFYLRLTKEYLQRLELGAKTGMWQVCVYYFAADIRDFLLLQALLKEIYCVSEDLLAQTFKAHRFANLREHLLQFGLVKNLRPLEEIDYPLLGYRFLTPLNSRDLSTYIRVPAGFNDRES